MTTVTEQIFANNFWGLNDDGYQILTAKMNSNKKTYDEIKSFYNVRASLHEEFGRKLMKHAKNSIGREELGTLHNLLKAAHEEMERTAQAHIDLAQKLKSGLEVYLNNFILEQKDKKKLTQANVEKAHRFKQSSETYLSKVKEKYESDCAKLIILQTQIGSGSNNNKLTNRDIEKIKQKIERTLHEIKSQELEYKNACNKVADATEAWNTTWKFACDTYQIMEKQRLEFIHHSFLMYINMLSTASSQDQVSYERFWKSLDNYDAVKDIQTFINEKGTGAKIPEAEIFVDYTDDPAKTLQRHKIANFPVPPELISSPPVTEKPDFILEDGESSFQRVQSITSSNNMTISDLSLNDNSATTPITSDGSSISNSQQEPFITPTVSRSTTERKKSILRNVMKPLSSISTPLIKPKLKRNSIHIETQQEIDEQQEKTIPIVPTIAVSDNSSPSTTDTSEDENEAKFENKNEEEDVAIDPRAKVVFAIGNNMFDLGHLDLNDEYTDYKPTATRSALRTNKSTLLQRAGTRRLNKDTTDLKAVCNFSYQTLLEELGVYDAKKEKVVERKPVKKNREPIQSGIKEANDDEYITNNKKEPELKHNATNRKLQPQPLQVQTNQHIPATDYHTNTNNNNSDISPVNMNGQQDMYPVNHVDPYIQPRQHHPQHPHYPSQQQTQIQAQYYQQYTNATPVNQMYHPNQNYNHQPPPENISSGVQPIKFWALALSDWYSGNQEELQFSRGTWLAVTEIGPNGWYYAIKYDGRMNSLSNEKGYVSQSVVQVHS